MLIFPDFCENIDFSEKKSNTIFFQTIFSSLANDSEDSRTVLSTRERYLWTVLSRIENIFWWFSPTNPNFGFFNNKKTKTYFFENVDFSWFFENVDFWKNVIFQNLFVFKICFSSLANDSDDSRTLFMNWFEPYRKHVLDFQQQKSKHIFSKILIFPDFSKMLIFRKTLFCQTIFVTRERFWGLANGIEYSRTLFMNWIEPYRKHILGIFSNKTTKKMKNMFSKMLIFRKMRFFQKLLFSKYFFVARERFWGLANGIEYRRVRFNPPKE